MVKWGAHLGQNKHKYLTGTAPTFTRANYAKWIQEDAQTRSLIWHSIEPTILGTVMHYDSTKGLWDALNVRYGQAKNGSRLCQLYRQFFDCRQNGHSLLDYFAELDFLWDQLTTLQPFSTNINVLTNQRNMLRIVKFLPGLDHAYESSRHQIIS